MKKSIPQTRTLWLSLSLFGLVAVSAQELQNGSMTEGGAQPTGWKLYKSSGTLVLTRDTTTFKAEPASLCLSSEGNAAVGNASQLITSNGGSYTISGFVKVEGELEQVLVAVQTFEGDTYNQQDWITICDATKDTSDWREFSKTISIPTNIKKFSVLVTLKGTGKVWLDEVSAKPAP